MSAERLEPAVEGRLVGRLDEQSYVQRPRGAVVLPVHCSEAEFVVVRRIDERTVVLLHVERQFDHRRLLSPIFIHNPKIVSPRTALPSERDAELLLKQSPVRCLVDITLDRLADPGA